MTVRQRNVLSQSQEDYLKALYHLQAGAARVSVTAVAREQSVSPASASAMVKKLAALEDDANVSEQDGHTGKVRPFRRDELTKPLERWFFGHARR